MACCATSAHHTRNSRCCRPPRRPCAGGSHQRAAAGPHARGAAPAAGAAGAGPGGRGRLLCAVPRTAGHPRAGSHGATSAARGGCWWVLPRWRGGHVGRCSWVGCRGGPAPWGGGLAGCPARFDLAGRDCRGTARKVALPSPPVASAPGCHCTSPPCPPCRQAILGAPLGMTRLMDLLEEQEVLRNEALLLLTQVGAAPAPLTGALWGAAGPGPITTGQDGCNTVVTGLEECRRRRRCCCACGCCGCYQACAWQS